jgi:hypothetical protein
MSHIMAARYEQGSARLETALDAMRKRDRAKRDAGYGYALGHLALVAADRGDYARAELLLTEARAAIEASGQVAMLGALATTEGIVFALRGDWAGCGQAALRAREVAERIHGAYQRHMAATLEGLALFHGAGDASGIERMRAAALFLESRGIGLTLSWNFACLAEALVLHGHADEALAHANTAIARIGQGDGLGQACALRVRALAKRIQGQDAASDLQASLAAARAKQSPREELVTCLYWCEASGEPIDAAWIERFEQLGMPWYAARAKRALAQSERRS